MKNFLTILLIFVCFDLYSQQTDKQLARNRSEDPIIANHLSAGYFDSIPLNYINVAAQYKLLFQHASIGFTIGNGLDCIQGTRTNPAECKLYPAYKYDRRNWIFVPRGNSGWYGKITDFVNRVNLSKDTYDIFSFKYCYLDGIDGINVPCGGTYSPSLVKKAWDSLRTNMERLEQKYPGKIFIWWTIPLTQTGQHCTDTLNSLIRRYVNDNSKILFDIADIEARDSFGNHLVNGNGWEIAYYAWCGEKPPGPSCHPNWPGSIMIAKAFWWMMARIAGMPDSASSSADSLPVVITSAISNIGQTTAQSGGTVTSEGGKQVTERGIVWSTSPVPTTNLPAKTTGGSGKGLFSCTLSGLISNTKYYVRAYAINAVGTAYGNEISFTTLNATDIKEADKNERYKVYSAGKFIEIQSFVNNPVYQVRIMIFDLYGREILNEFFSSSKISIDMSTKQPGCYFVILICNDYIENRKVIIE